MPQFSHIYDGKNTAVELPSGERLDRAQQRMSDLVLEADKMRLDAFKKNEDFFLKTTDVPVESFISNANTETQAKLLDEYNKKAVAIVKARGGMDKLTTEDKMELAKGRQFIEGEQKRMLGDYEKYKMAKALAEKNNTYYDLDRFNEAIGSTYLKTGRYPDIELPIRPKSIDLALNSRKIRGQGAWQETKPDPSNPQKEYTIEYSAKKADVIPAIVGYTLSDPQYLEEAKLDWEQLPDNEKKAFFDPNNPLAMEYAAMGVTNPVLMNYAEKHWKSGVGVTTNQPSFRNRATGAASTKYLIGGKQVAFSPGAKKEGGVQLSTRVYNAPVEFDGSYKMSYIPTLNAKELTGSSLLDITDQTNVEGYLKLYDPEKDVFVFATTGTDPNVPNGTLIEVPAKDLRDTDTGDLPVTDNGKKTTIGQIRANRMGVKKQGALDNL